MFEVSVYLLAGYFFGVSLQGIDKALPFFRELISILSHELNVLCKEGNIFLCVDGSAFLVEPLEVFRLCFN